MRYITLSLLAVILSTGVAGAERDRRDRDRAGRNDRNERPPVVRDRGYNRPVVRDNRGSYRRQRYTGPVRANRRVIDRRPLYVSSGNSFRFHNGRTVVYSRPIIRQRYYDVRVRPQIIVENYPSQYGYIWVNGNWGWNGGEWSWTTGHYEADPSINVYYDDESYDVRDDGY